MLKAVRIFSPFLLLLAGTGGGAIAILIGIGGGCSDVGEVAPCRAAYAASSESGPYVTVEVDVAVVRVGTALMSGEEEGERSSLES